MDFTLVKKILASVFIILLCLSSSFAQQEHTFKTGLLLPNSHSYGRKAEYVDKLAHKLYSGELKTPAEGQVVFANELGEDVKWDKIEVDPETKGFRGTAKEMEEMRERMKQWEEMRKRMERGEDVGDMRRPDRQGDRRRQTINGRYLYLTYNSSKEQSAVLHINSSNMVYVNGEPRVGDHNGYGYVYLPIQLKKGLNEFYVRMGGFARSGMIAKLIFETKPAFMNVEDPTLPIFIANGNIKQQKAAIVVVNNTGKPQKALTIKCSLGGKEMSSILPEIPARTIRKVAFDIDASAISTKGKHTANLELTEKGKLLDKKELAIEMVNPGEDYSETFVSEIDGSLQYYSVSPQLLNPSAKLPALFFSVHGAGVEAINQARAYKSKEEGVLVAPTNRRPRGFNWEDWGMLDALEVLNIAKNKFTPDPQRIYLTGHSMGGHGTWFLGATFAGQWAAIAPCAGYPTLAGYGSADGLIPREGRNNVEKMIIRSSNQSDVYQLSRNYNAGGVYIYHGDADPTVSVNYARDMHKHLAEFSKDLSYYEYPGGNHWYGDESVDWKPLFDYFSYHTIPHDTAVNEINFTTANTGTSSKHFWVSILQQKESLEYSRVNLHRNKRNKNITGTTENIALLSFSLEGAKQGSELKITLDKQPEIKYTVKSNNDKIFLSNVDGKWQIVDGKKENEKGDVRNGTLKEPFRNRMVYVYGTSGTKDENTWAYNKARYDAESWYYRGNGAVDIVADKDFNPANYPDRGIIIYGNSNSNSAYNKLLSNCPIQIMRGKIKFGNKEYTGNDYGAYFMWPRADSKVASVAVIGGTGVKGMGAADSNQYFTGASGFPDYLVFSSQIMEKGLEGIKEAGFYNNQWQLVP